MANLKEHLQLDPEDWSATTGMAPASSSASTGAMPSTSTSASASPIPTSTTVLQHTPRERAHTRTPAEHERRIAHVVREYMRQEAHGVPPGVSPMMTKIKCLHASVAQKSYGSEKRFLCPPPVVHITGSLRYTPNAPLLLMQVQGEDSDSFSGEQVSPLDDTQHARFTELHVTGTGKAKSFRLQLHLLAPHDGPEPTKRMRLGHGETAAVRSTSWASFDSAPIGIISKPSKRIAKARNVSAHITKDTSVSLFNRINSQTYRTKYLCAQDGRLSAQSRTWTAFRLVLLSRREAAAPRDTADESVLTYGSVIVLIDPASGAATDPLIVCKVDRGRILPPIDGGGDEGQEDDELSAWGAVTQMQKVALLRYMPSDRGAWILDAHMPRTYLCAGTPTHDTTVRVGETTDDAHSLPLTFASTQATSLPSGAPVDEAEDAFCWTLVGISHFEYAYIDVDMLDMPTSSPSVGLSLTPFPLVTTMPYYDAPTHKLAMTVQNFFYVRDSAALQTPREAYAAARAPGAALAPLEVWLGPLGPLILAFAPLPDSDEAEVAVQLPSLKSIIEARVDQDSDAPPSQCTLPLLFVRGYDSTIYHSGRHVLCQDLVAVVRAAGDIGAANALQKLNVGLGEQAGAHELPAGSVWTLRVI
ncbi:RNA polymerase II-specific DNA-binding transcription factor [Malassezia pachydermatis]